MTDESYITHKAQIYERYKDSFHLIHPDIKRSFRENVDRAFKALPSTITIDFVDGQPYENHLELTTDIRYLKRLRVSKDYNDSPLLPGILNLQFRAIHDFLHYILQAPFDAMGELRVFNTQKKFHPEEIEQKILFSEVVLQACFKEHFGKFPEVQKVVLYDGQI